MFFSLISLCVGALWGVAFYYAVMHRVDWCAAMCAVSFAFYEADKFYKSPLINGFIKGLNG